MNDQAKIAKAAVQPGQATPAAASPQTPQVNPAAQAQAAALKMYFGVRHPETRRCMVSVEYDDSITPLSPRHDLRNHSPDGFEWGYQGSGPAQLALALLADAVGPRLAQWLYHDFKRAYMAKCQAAAWVLSEREIHEWVSLQCAIRGGIENAET